MTAAPAWIIEIENRARGLPVLLVEGKEDETWFSYFFGSARARLAEPTVSSVSRRQVPRDSGHYRPPLFLDRDR